MVSRERAGRGPPLRGFGQTNAPAVRGVQRLRPRLDYELHATGLGRNDLGALPVAAGLGRRRARADLPLALNGLRASEATGADVAALGVERGHWLLRHHPQGRQGRDPPAPRTAPLLTWPSTDAAKGRYARLLMAGGWTGTAPGGSSAE
jgi:hypothetical protein